MRGRAIAAVLTTAAVLAACHRTAEPLSVDSAWVRLPAVPGRPAAGYFQLHGGPAPATLLSVTTDVAIRTEMHESMANGMRPLASVAVPAGATVAFQPGGRHVMLFDMNPGITPARTMTLTLTFADGTRLTRKAVVVNAGDPAPE